MTKYHPCRRGTKAVMIALAACLLLAAGCGTPGKEPEGAARQQGMPAQTQESPAPEISGFREVPGITQEEIDAIEALRRQGAPLVYGTIQSTESFVGEDGEIKGFTALLCRWLADFFGITFMIRMYEWDGLIAGLESGDVDFTGELTATPERRRVYHMTDAIGGRSLVHLRIAGSTPLSHVAASRPLRFAFLAGTTTIDDVAAQFAGGYEVFQVNNYEEAYTLLKTGQIDSFIEEETAEAAFDIYGDVLSERFYPLIYGPVSLSTQKEANAPLISAVQKALLHTDLQNHLTGLHNAGAAEYKKHKFIMSLTEEELAYISRAGAIVFAAEQDNYPVSFYNAREDEWQGVFFDVLREVESLTGLTFEQTEEKQEQWAALLQMLERGEVRLLSEVIRTPEREGDFLWPDTPLLIDNYALLSKAEHPGATINDVWHKNIGLVTDTAHAKLFERWFPNHLHTVWYTNFDDAFDALQSGEVDMVMSSRYHLLALTNYSELVGYKANIVFDYQLRSSIGFYKGDEMLCNIIEKALRQIDTPEIERFWTSRTYDYTAKLAAARLPWLTGTIIMLAFALILLTVFFQRHRRAQLLAAENAMLSDLNRSKTEFLQDMKHEMRTPLTVIATGIDVVDHIISKENIDVGKARSAIGTVREETQRIGRMISAMLTVASMSELGENRRRTSFADLLTSATEAFRTTLEGNKLSIDMGPGLPDVFVEYDRIVQVITNLLSNAAEHTTGGEITVCARQSGMFIEVAVSDNGSGIEPHVLPWVFERGVSGRRSTGYGLYICKAVVEAHGGTISIESSLGEGTCVRFTVPVYGGQEAGHNLGKR